MSWTRTFPKLAAVLGAVAAVAALASPAHAGERQFTYVYEPLTLGPGQIELEQSIQPRLGKAGGVFSEIDLHSEIEFGIVDDLQASLYLNTVSTHAADARSGRHGRGFITDDSGKSKFSSFELDTVSNEWLWKILDPVADPIGLALYVEPETNGQEFELEEKIILGKVWGDLTVAANLAFEQDWRASTGEPNRALHFNFSAGVAYRIPGLPVSVGLEFRQENRLDYYTEYTHAVFSLGPNVHFARGNFWATLTVLPQLVSPTRTYKSFDYDAYEVCEVRIIVGMEF